MFRSDASAIELSVSAPLRRPDREGAMLTQPQSQVAGEEKRDGFVVVSESSRDDRGWFAVAS
jgi:hypothetical protein